VQQDDASLAGTFRSPWWLRGAHPQTIVPALLARRARVTYARDRWDTPDDDIIEVDHAQPRNVPAGAVLVVFHGLESDTRSRYVRGLVRAAIDVGWSGVAPHFRGCGGTMNLAPRFYHSGDSEEVDWILRRVADEARGVPVVAAGVSLGGNMLLKWLGERGDSARSIVAAAAAVSAPLDLVAGGENLGVGFNRFYTWLFLRTLKVKSRAKLGQHAGLFDRARMEAARTLHAFDDVVTGPVHGFADAMDYWTRSSSKPLLRSIAVPTLILNARNDPFLPASALPGPGDVSPQVTLEQPADGGHVGFIDAGPDGAEWMPRHVVGFLERHLP
jgi:predicted alpha/beta-fold hydrolase